MHSTAHFLKKICQTCSFRAIIYESCEADILEEL